MRWSLLYRRTCADAWRSRDTRSFEEPLSRSRHGSVAFLRGDWLSIFVAKFLQDAYRASRDALFNVNVSWIPGALLFFSRAVSLAKFCSYLSLSFYTGMRGAQARRVYKERKVGEAATLLQSLSRGVCVV